MSRSTVSADFDRSSGVRGTRAATLAASSANGTTTKSATATRKSVQTSDLIHGSLAALSGASVVSGLRRLSGSSDRVEGGAMLVQVVQPPARDRGSHCSQLMTDCKNYTMQRSKPEVERFCRSTTGRIETGGRKASLKAARVFAGILHRRMPRAS